MLHCAAIPTDVNPAVRPALDALALLLTDYHYSAAATTGIVAYVAAEGTVTGAPGLEAEDEADASMVFEAELEPVPFDSPEWGDDFDPDQGAGPVFEPEDLRDPHDWPEPPSDWPGDAATGWVSLPPDEPDDDGLVVESIVIRPICGGAPEPDERDAQDHRDWLASIDGPEPFAPSPDDLADMHARRDATDCIYGYE